MLEIGANAPDFQNLQGTDSERYSLHSFDGKPVLVLVFTCNHCPYSQAYEDRMIALQRDFAGKNVQLVAINSNDEKNYPEDAYPLMVKLAKDKGFNFPYIRDQDQSVAEAYGAVCTPHVFAFDKDRKLRYRGRIDDSKDPSRVQSQDLRNAISDLTAGKGVRVPDTRPFGCFIKWMVV